MTNIIFNVPTYKNLLNIGHEAEIGSPEKYFLTFVKHLKSMGIDNIY